MRTYALINDDTVKEVRSLEESDVHSLGSLYQNIVDITDIYPRPDVGWLMQGANLIPIQGYSPTNAVITRLAFRNRFTNAEKVALYSAAATPQGVGLKVYLDDLAAATFVDLTRADTIASINYLASIGLITPQRAAEILSTNISAIEAFKE